MTTLKLEVGKTYLDRKGGQVLIDFMRVGDMYPAESGVNKYTADGRFYFNDKKDARDLISEYIEPAQPAARTPHKWAKEMHAFADGYEIQKQLTWGAIWQRDTSPYWDAENYEYRIKPESAPLKPNAVDFINYLIDGKKYSVRIEFNPNTQALVSAEVVTL